MDERHWWITSHLQQSFLSSNHNAVESKIEEFISKEDTLDLLHEFFISHSPKVIFIYLCLNEDDLLVKATLSPKQLQDSFSNSKPCGYFLKLCTDEITVENFEQHLFFGEIKQSNLNLFYDVFRTTLNMAYINTKGNTDESINVLLNEMTNYLQVFSDFKDTTIMAMQVLKIPKNLSSHDFKKSRITNISPQVLAENEEVVCEWIQSIENVLKDSLDERLDIHSGLISMLSEWKRRLKIIRNVMDQVKSKECKSVLAVLIAGKSKVLKNWRSVDGLLTDVSNDVKEKVKYLESFGKRFDDVQFQTDLSLLSNSVMPDFISHIRQLDTISRFYAKNGFLGSLFAKISYQLTIHCKESINQCIFKNKDGFTENENMFCKMLVNENLKEKCKYVTIKKEFGSENFPSKPLTSTLYASLMLCQQYKDMYYSLIDVFGGKNTLQYTPQQSGIYMLMKRLNQQGTLLKTVNNNIVSNGTTSLLNMDDTFSTFDSTDDADYPGGLAKVVYGISFTDIDSIMEHVNKFSERVQQLLNIIETLKQFTVLIESTKGLPQLSYETWYDIPQVEGDDQSSSEIQFNEDDDHDGASDSQASDEQLDIYESLSKKLDEDVKTIKKFLKHSLTCPVFVEIEQSDKFNNIFVTSSSYIENIENNIIHYIKSVFAMRWNTQQQLDMLLKFEPVLNRSSLVEIFREKYTNVLQSYEHDLENIEQIYEAHKEKPPMYRNLPIVSSAISWSKGLLRKIENTMQQLKSVKLVHSIKRYDLAVKYYNRIATALIKYEDSYIAAWNSQIINCLSLLNVTLLAHEVESKKIIVYADPRILEIFSDSKILKQLGFTIPKNAAELLTHESKFKKYKQRLENVVNQYYDVKENIAPHLNDITAQLSKTTFVHFQPGLSVLKWNSLNVDAFLFKLEKAVDRFQSVIQSIDKKILNEVDVFMEEIKSVIIFNETLFGTWDIQVFSQMIQEISNSSCLQLNKLFDKIELSLKELISLVNLKEKKKSSNQTLLKPSQDLQDKEKQRMLAYELNLYESLLTHYADHIFNALKVSITNALELFYSCLQENSKTKLNFKVVACLLVPDFYYDPPLVDIDNCLVSCTQFIVNICKQLCWFSGSGKKSLYDDIVADPHIKFVVNRITQSNKDIALIAKQNLDVFERFTFLWKDDMNSMYKVFEETYPDNIDQYHNKVQQFVDIDDGIRNINDQIELKTIVLTTTPIKDALIGFCFSWKNCYVQTIYKNSQISLDDIILQRETYHSHLVCDIHTLVDLKNVLTEIEKINDLNNHIDEIYLPIETQYETLLKKYKIPLLREEIKNVHTLRDKWSDLISLGDEVLHNVMRERRAIFEQKLDKEVKEFVIEVIQFRNKFDSQGPGIPGISPSEAVYQLKEFQQKHDEFDERRKTLHAIQKIFGIYATPFTELQKTGKELCLLTQLYDIFQSYIEQHERFCETLWADVQLEENISKINELWENCSKLPAVVHNWYAYKDLQERLNNYLDLFPILQQLASKEIRNRHWLQVMHVTKKSFQLEANIFKLKHIIDIGLVKHKDDIASILNNSQTELLSEIKLRKIEEEWSEQVFKFDKYKGRGPVVFNKGAMRNILDVLESDKITLSSILSSKQVTTFHEEAASWAVKLNEMGDVIEQWISVEELWMHLESIFTTNGVSKDLPQQFATFSKTDRSYMKMVKKAVENSNVVQCCLVGDISKMVVLKDIYKDLEVCFKSLSSYLEQKRKIFPRFNFITDKILLLVLSKPFDLEDILPYLRDIMTCMSNVETYTDEVEIHDKPTSSPAYATQGRRRTSYVHATDICRERFSVSIQSSEEGESRSSRLGSIINQNLFIESDWIQKNPKKNILAVVDEHGEKILLSNQVLVTNVIEEWISKLLSEIKSTILKDMKKCVTNIKEGCSLEEIIMKYCTQVAFMMLLFYWTNQCAKAIREIKSDRKSFLNMNKKFLSLTNRLMQTISKGVWRSTNIRISNIQKLRMETVIGNSLYLRDTFDELVTNRKVRDVNDFDWKQTIKCYEDPDESKSIQLSILDDTFDYEHEFLGAKLSFIMTPATDRCVLNLMLALSQKKGGCITGGNLTGKTEIIKGLSFLFGQFIFILNCKLPITKASMNRIFTGLCADGSFVCFDNIQFFAQDFMALFHYYLKVISHALISQSKTVNMLEMEKVNIIPSCGVFLTTNKSFMKNECPVHIKEKFRVVSLIQPDVFILLRSYLISYGFKCARELAQSIKVVSDICQHQIQSKLNFSIPVLKTVIKRASLNLKVAESNISTDVCLPKLVSAASSFSHTVGRTCTKQPDRYSVVPPTPSSDILKDESTYIAQSFVDVVGARLSDQEGIILTSTLHSVFEYHSVDVSSKENEFSQTLVKLLAEKNLSSQQPFVNKVIQYYHLSQVHESIVVCGVSKSGKTSCSNILLDSLQTLAQQNNLNISYKYEHINVLAVSTLDMIFGSVDKQGIWCDGIFTMLMKKANQQPTVHKTSTWVCFDGPLHDDWCSKLDTLIESTKVFVQPDLRRFHLNEHVKILFETDVLNNASPDIVAKMGILYIDASTVGWRALAEAWLAGRPSQQLYTLQRSFHKCVDRVIQFVQDEAELCVNLSECALFSSCLNLLASLLKEHTELGGEMHIERLFIFSLIWSIGGLLKHDGDKNHFNTLLLSLSNVLPDDDHQISVFDYYVDESGEWDAWGNKLVEVDTVEAPDVFYECYIETLNTMQTRFFLNLLSSASYNVLLIGDRTSGKSSLVQNFLKKQGNKKQILKQLIYSKATTCNDLQNVLEKTLVHRRGFVYGGKNNKSLKLFIDDIDLPLRDLCNEQSVNELLQQLIDRRMIYSSSKGGYQIKNIEGLSLLATMKTPANSSHIQPSDEDRLSRLLGNFTILKLSNPTYQQINTIISSMLEGCMRFNDSLSLPETLHNQIVSATAHIYEVMVKAFNSCDYLSYSRYHLGDVKNLFNMLQLCPEESRVEEDEKYLLLFWMHEIKRVFADRINNVQQLDWFQTMLQETVEKYFNGVEEDSNSIFTTFAVNSHLRTQRQNKSTSKVGLFHEKITTFLDTYPCFHSFLTKYNNDKNKSIQLNLHDYNISQLIKVHRLLSQQNGTNGVLVSSEIDVTVDMVRLISFMLEYHIQEITSKSNFLHELRVAMRMAGCDHKHIFIMVKANEVTDPMFYDAINSLINIGEYAPLLNDTEMHALLMTVMPLIKKKYSIFRFNPKAFFTSCVKKYLHIIVLTTPDDNFLTTLATDYRGIACKSYMDWNIDSSVVQLKDYSFSILSVMPYWSHFDEKTRTQLIDTFIGLHNHMVSETNEDNGIYEDVKDFADSSTILENKMITFMSSKQSKKKQFNSSSFKHLLRSFNAIAEKKMADIIAKTKHRRHALECLKKVRAQVSQMQEQKLSLQQEYITAEKEVEEMNSKLFAQSSLVEKLKAKLDIGSGSFRAFMSLIESEMIESDDDTTTSQEDQDELDMEYERIQATTNQMKSLDEQIQDMKALLVKLEEEIQIAKESLMSFQVKIDRGCIERLRAFQSPPALVGTVMVMVMILIGRPEFSSYVVSSKRERKQNENSVNKSVSSQSRTSSAKSRRTGNQRSLQLPSIVNDGKVDRALWKTVQQIMQDSQKFCEFMNNYNWCEGVSDDVLHTIISMFAYGEETPLSERNQTLQLKPDPQALSGGVSIQAARYSSEDAAQMVEYVQSVIHFTKKYLPFKVAKKKLKMLETEKLIREKELEEMKRTDDNVKRESIVEEEDILEALGQDDLPVMESELNTMKLQFDTLAMKKHVIRKQLTEFTSLLDTNVALLNSMQNMETTWSRYKEDGYLHSNLLSQCIVAASFLSYCGPFNIDQRKTLTSKFFSICEANGLSICEENNLLTQSIMTFLKGEVESNKFILNHVCNGKISMDLFCLLTCHDVMSMWPIMFDPHGLGVYMLKQAFPNLHIMKFDNFSSEIENALRSGFHVLLTEMCIEHVGNNKKLMDILKSQQQFVNASAPFKLLVGDKEIDCSPNFRLIMATTSDINHVNRNGITSFVNLILVELSRDALVEIFFSQFMLVEKAQIEESYVEYKQELAKLIKSKFELEEEFISCFVSNTSFENIISIRKILHVKKLYDETHSYELKSEETIATLSKSREVYKPIAIQAACMFQVASSMRHLNPLYEISIEQFLSYFHVAVNISDRSGVSSITNKVLDAIFVVLCKSKLEEDRNLLALFTALETEDSLGKVSIGDREFLISPRYGALIKQPHIDADTIPPKSSQKKPFDWMSDEQYNNLLILSQNFDWFTETFEKMPKDGREMQWRQICEHDTPETLSLPDNLDERYSPLQRLLVIRAFRSDRLTQAANIFVTITLGKKFANDASLELKSLYHQMKCNVPILMIYNHDSVFCWQILNNFAISKQVLLISFQVSGQPMEEEILKKLLFNAMQKGCWLYLNHIQCDENIMKNVVGWIKSKKNDSGFRLWLSVDINSKLSTTFLHSCLTVMMMPSVTKLKNSILQNLSLVPSELWREISGTDFYPIVYNICVLHSCFIERLLHSIPYKSKRDDMGFHVEVLLDAFKLVLTEIKRINEENEENVSIHQFTNQNIKSLPWLSIRSYLNMMYSGKLDTLTDLSALSSLIEYWISAAAVKKDFEISRALYKHPIILFNNVVKLSALQSAIEALPPFDSIEFTGLLQKENKILDDGKNFLQLRSLYEKLPETSSLIHRHQSLHEDGGAANLLSVRENDLMEITANILNKIPRLWSKDFVSERIRRTGGLTAFNMWLINEADAVCALHHTIKSTSMKLQEILDSSSSWYDSSLLSVAVDLVRNKVPSQWLAKAGMTSLPQHCPINAWINDFDLRCKHIEKVLLLGRERMPGYWLAAFFYPKRLISVIIQDSIQHSNTFANGEKLTYVIKTEITTRDKDHLRDPPSEGIFIHGIHLWGAHWEKATNELQDTPAKSNSPYSLPVIHLQVIPKPEKSVIYSCPCFISRASCNEEILTIGIYQKDVPASKWALRSLMCTLRPF